MAGLAPGRALNAGALSQRSRRASSARIVSGRVIKPGRSRPSAVEAASSMLQDCVFCEVCGKPLPALLNPDSLGWTHPRLVPNQISRCAAVLPTVKQIPSEVKQLA